MVIKFLYIIQLNVSTTATLGTEESGHYGEATVVERFEQESVNDCPPKRVAVVERWPLVEV